MTLPFDVCLVRKAPLLSNDPLSVYERVHRKGELSILLESGRFHHATGRYSWVLTNPFLVFRSKGRLIDIENRLTGEKHQRRAHPMETLKSLVNTFSMDKRLSSLPFCGGAVGYLGYEMKNFFEKLPQRSRDDCGLPDAAFAFFDRGIFFDHATHETGLFCLIQSDKKGSQEAAHLWMDKMQECLKVLEDQGADQTETSSLTSLPLDIRHDLTQYEFEKMVQKAKRHIQRGDIYQANLSQRFRFELADSPEAYYRRLKLVNPSPFGGLMDFGDFQIISGSPERLVRLQGKKVETRPIAGTRRRGESVKEDRELTRELVLNEKERAEHIMLVDLERNDLGRVCEAGSVRVDEFLTVEDYSHVKHIVSNVCGTLSEGKDRFDVLRSLFPGGTITGAPKIRSMQIIDELEPTARGPYTGSMGYLSFSGEMDMNIIIRSLVVRNGHASLQVGAGIVADSEPDREYDETLYKAEALLQAAKGRSFKERKERFTLCQVS